MAPEAMGEFLVTLSQFSPPFPSSPLPSFLPPFLFYPSPLLFPLSLLSFFSPFPSVSRLSPLSSQLYLVVYSSPSQLILLTSDHRLLWASLRVSGITQGSSYDWAFNGPDSSRRETHLPLGPETCASCRAARLRWD